jgi:hypothetical protein
LRGEGQAHLLTFRPVGFDYQPTFPKAIDISSRSVGTFDAGEFEPVFCDDRVDHEMKRRSKDTLIGELVCYLTLRGFTD